MSKRLDKITKLEQRVLEDYGYKENGFISMLERSKIQDDIKDILIVFSNYTNSEISNVRQINMELIDLVKDQHTELDKTKEDLTKANKRSIFSFGGLWMLIAMIILLLGSMFIMHEIDPDGFIKIMVTLIDLSNSFGRML